MPETLIPGVTAGQAASAEATTSGKKGERSIFSRTSWTGKRNSPRVDNSVATAKVKHASTKGRGRRPGSNMPCISGDGSAGDAGVAQGVDVGGGWILYADYDGQQYYWNEILQESRSKLSTIIPRRCQAGNFSCVMLYMKNCLYYVLMCIWSLIKMTSTRSPRDY